MTTHNKEANGFCLKHFEHIADGEKVAQAFGHFFVINVNEAVVHPDLRHRFARSALALGNFVFMVRKL